MKTRNLIGKQFGHPRMTVLPYWIETSISRKDNILTVTFGETLQLRCLLITSFLYTGEM